MKKKRIVIVGAGPGGLTNAMILAHRGFDVTVFEAAGAVGGRNAPLKVGGYTFDTGPTFLMMNFVLGEMFGEAGKNVADYLTFKQLDPMYDLQFDDRTVTVSSDPAAMRREIAAKFPGNEAGFDHFLAKEKTRYEYLFPCIQRDYSTFSRLFSPMLLKALPYLSAGKSIFQNLGRYFGEDKLKLSFTFQAKYLGMSPWDCPAFFTMLPYIEHAFGIYHVMGGLNRISAAMAQAAQENGATIHTRTPVRSLILDGRKVTGVTLENGERVMADEVVINADFAHAMTELVPPGTLKKYSGENIAKKEFSCSTFMLYLGVNKRYPMRHHTIVFAKDYRTNVGEVFREKRLSDDFSVYVQNASVTDPSLAPDGKSALYILVPVPNREAAVDWTREKSAFRDRVIHTLAAKTPMTDLAAHIEEERVITPLDWERELRIYRGATFNLAHTFSQLLYLRPRNRFEELENCFLVGGGTHPGSGLPTIYESARISANLISQKHRVPFAEPDALGEKTMISPSAS